MVTTPDLANAAHNGKENHPESMSNMKYDRPGMSKGMSSDKQKTAKGSQQPMHEVDGMNMAFDQLLVRFLSLGSWWIALIVIACTE